MAKRLVGNKEGKGKGGKGNDNGNEGGRQEREGGQQDDGNGDMSCGQAVKILHFGRCRYLEVPTMAKA